MQVIILAAGAGTRLGMNLPKCMIEINGKTILYNQVETIKSIDDTALITVVTGYKNRLVEQEVYKIQQTLYPLIKTTHNTEAQNLGIVRSLEIAEQEIIEPDVLRISGDIYINSFNNLKDLIQKDTVLAVQKVPYQRGDAVILRQNDLMLTNEHTVTDDEWIDIDYYTNFDFNKIMRASSWYKESTQHHYQLLRHAIKSNIVSIKPVSIYGTYEIDTLKDLENVRRSNKSS